VIGDAVGHEVRVEGRVEGRLAASERIVIAATGRGEGDVEAPRGVIDEGATLKGCVRMGGEGRGRAATAGERP
jgi:cytoskeletal protein CcmA (bactofilin family)